MTHIMDRYKLLKELGDGTCGTVYKAVNMETYETVAVKKMKRKYYFWEEFMNLREIKSLRKLIHPNIIKLIEVTKENNELFFIFEYMEYNLFQLMKERQSPFSEEEIRNFMTQILKGLAHMHRNGYFHRDLKPENLLVTNDVIKIADFGLAREVSSLPPYTDYVSTRWYRAPEVLLQCASYTPAIDMWAVGAILAELFTLCPLFPGESEADQLYKICCILGTPDWTAFPEAKNFTVLINISHSEFFTANMSKVITNASLEAIDLITRLCSWDPNKRLSAEEALQHPFFHVGTWVPRSIYETREATHNNRSMHSGSCAFVDLSTGTEPNLELNLWNFDTKSDECSLGLTLAVKPSVSDRDLVSSASQKRGQDVLSYSGFHDHPRESVFWSLFSPSRNRINATVGPSLPHSFSSVGASRSQSTSGYTILDGPPLLAVSSSPLKHRRFL